MNHVFIHAHRDDNDITYQNVRETALQGTHDMHSMNTNCLYLSRCINMKEKLSYWIQHCIDTKKDEWIDVPRYAYKLSKDAKIWILTYENLYQFLDLFGINYTHYSKYNEDSIELAKIHYTQKTRWEIMKRLEVLANAKIKPKNAEKTILFNNREMDNALGKLDHWDGEAYCCLSRRWNSTLDVDYHKMRNMGYQGLYISKEFMNQKYRFIKGDSVIGEWLSYLTVDTLMIWDHCLVEE